MKKQLDNKQYTARRKGFTLAELIVALTMTVVILTAITALTFAVGSANDVANDTNAKQAQLRYATIRITELIRHCKLICKLEENNIAIWRADDNNNDQINLSEIVYIGSGYDRNYVRILEFPNDNRGLTFGGIKPIVSGWMDYGSTYTYTMLIPECENVTVALDTAPPFSRFATISFDLEENGSMRHYQINASLRSSSENLLRSSGAIIVSDDD